MIYFNESIMISLIFFWFKFNKGMLFLFIKKVNNDFFYLLLNKDVKNKVRKHLTFKVYILKHF